jgi:hypothetical protein
MFVAEHLAMLGEEYFDFTARVVVDWKVQDVVECLGGGGLVLMPYDCSANHEPMVAYGEKSHWCVVAGFSTDDVLDDFKMEEGNDQLKRFQQLPVPGGESLGAEHFICVQSKSKKVFAWSCEAMQESNYNLRECQTKQRDGDKIVPSDLSQTLGRRIVLVIP